MNDERDPSDRPQERETGGADSGREIIPQMAMVVEKTSRFSKEVMATMMGLASAALGFVAALAWNTAITQAFTTWLGQDSASKVGALFVYAVVVTVVGVVVIVTLARIATRINAQPIEFKYPGAPRS